MRTKGQLSIAALAALGLIGANATDVEATNFSCKSGTTCQWEAGCDGDFFDLDACKIQCYKQIGPGGEIEDTGSAECS